MHEEDKPPLQPPEREFMHDVKKMFFLDDYTNAIDDNSFYSSYLYQ